MPKIFNGTNGADVMTGSTGDDFMTGYAGNDVMRGGAGRDEFYGGSGNDTITGGTGYDRMSGQGGADVFHFTAGDGLAGDSILDFQRGADKLSFIGVSPRTVTQTKNAYGDVEIHYAGSPGTIGPNSVTLVGVTDYLTSTDYLFG